MVKTKSGRLMNPTDAFRKEQRKREVNRNKMERKFQREAHRMISNPVSLKEELQNILNLEKDGSFNKMLRLKKKVLQDAYDQSLKRKKDEESRLRLQSNFNTAIAQKALRPEDSPYYHPTLNPTGTPPPGKVTAFQCPEPSDSVYAPTQASLPVPEPPPLPPGPRPNSDDEGQENTFYPPLPHSYSNSYEAKYLRHNATPYFRHIQETRILPPPVESPPSDIEQSENESDSEMEQAPGMQAKCGNPLPPPSHRPPGFDTANNQALPSALLAPMALNRVPPPPPLTRAGPFMYESIVSPPMPRPSLPPPYSASASISHKRDVQAKPIITGHSTVIKKPPPQNYKSLTRMVPRSVLMKKHEESSKVAIVRKPNIAPGFGLAPLGSSVVGTVKKQNVQIIMDQKINDFLKEVDKLGNTYM